MNTFIEKITSRKFILSLAAFLASIGTSIAGLQIGNQTIAAVGIVCSIISAAMYAATEAYVDAASIKSTSTTTVNQNTKTTLDSTVKKTDGQ